MKRFLTVIAMVACMALAAAAPASASTKATTIQTTEKHDRAVFIDNDPPGPSIGDEFTGSGDLYQLGSLVGHINFHCTSVNDRDSRFLCDATFVFPASGSIDVSGVYNGLRLNNRFGVTGGTGAYAGASGTATMASSPHTSVWTIRLT
jgi:hypothetical protein